MQRYHVTHHRMPRSPHHSPPPAAEYDIAAASFHDAWHASARLAASHPGTVTSITGPMSGNPWRDYFAISLN